MTVQRAHYNVKCQWIKTPIFHETSIIFLHTDMLYTLYGLFIVIHSGQQRYKEDSFEERSRN